MRFNQNKVFVSLLIIIGLFIFQVEEINACGGAYSSVCGQVGGARSGGGILTYEDDFVVPEYGDRPHGMRVYLVEDVGGSRPKLVSNVKDITNIQVYSNSVWPIVTRFSVNSTNGTLGTRWDYTYGQFSSATFDSLNINRAHIYGVAVPRLSQASNWEVRSFFQGLGGQNPSACGNVNNEYASCLHKFLVEMLGITDSTAETRLRQDSGLTNYYIIVEPAFRYQWQASLGGNVVPQHTWVVTAKEGYDLANFSLDTEWVQQGVPWYQTTWRWVFSRVFNHAPRAIWNQNPSGVPNQIQENRLSYLDAAPSPMNSNLTSGYATWDHALADYARNAYTYHFADASLGNHYRRGVDLQTRSGLGIGYFWFGQFSEDQEDCNDIVEQALDGLNLSSGAIPQQYRNFINGYITSRECCPEFRSEINRTPGGEHRNIMQADYNDYCVDPPDGDECVYRIDVDCPDCEDVERAGGVVSDIGSAASANNEEEWNCIFQSENAPTTPFNFRDHYIQNTPNNRYCKVFCREDLEYKYPDSDLYVPAGFHFTIGPPQRAMFTGDAVPHWGPVEFTGSADCRPTLARDKDNQPLDGDHDLLYIDHIQFVEDWENANEQVGDNYDKWQFEVVKNWAYDNAEFLAPNSQCGHFYQSSRSGDNGCIREQLMFACPGSSSALDGGSDRRNYKFTCRYTQSATASCSTGSYSNGSCYSRECEFVEDFGLSCTDVYEGSASYSCPSNYTRSGTNCYRDVDARTDGWDCTQTNSTQLRRVRSANYAYEDPNFLDNRTWVPTNDIWCATTGDIRSNAYSWETSEGSNDAVTRYISNAHTIANNVNSYVDASNTANRPSVSINLYRNRYNQWLSRRNSYLAQIVACQNFNYNYSRLMPDLEVSYEDYKYPEPDNYPLTGNVYEEYFMLYYVDGEEQSGSSTEEIERYDCSTPPTTTVKSRFGTPYGDGTKCEVNMQEYPNNDSWFYNKLRTISYILDEETYAYVTKADNRGRFEEDSFSYHHSPPSNNYIRLPYGNLPVHYYQGENIPADGILERDIWLELASPSFGPGNRFDDYVFGLNHTPLDCFDYVCDYYVIYRFPSPIEELDVLVQFRPIDLTNPFPGFSGTGRTRGKNWTHDETVNAIILNNRGAAGYDLYFNREPLYTIEMGANQIGQIRQYNRTNPFNLSNLDCRDLSGSGKHEECRSHFVDQFVDRAACLNTGFDACD